jgi:hypothetical protein
MVARYFDSIWPEYERQVVVDGSGAVTGERIQQRRRVSYFTVIYFFISHGILSFLFSIVSPSDYACGRDFNMDCILLYTC